MIKRSLTCEKCKQEATAILHRQRLSNGRYNLMWRCDHCQQNATAKTQPFAPMAVLRDYRAALDDLPIYDPNVGTQHRTLFDAQQPRQQPPTPPTADPQQATEARRLKMARIICGNAANEHSKALADKLSREWFNCGCNQLSAPVN